MLRNRSNSFTYTLDNSFKKLQWLQIGHSFSHALLWHQNKLQKSHPLSHLSSLLTMHGTLSPSLTLTARLQNQFLELQQGSFHQMHFLDLSLRYIMTKRLEWELTCDNLLNTQAYQVTTLDALNTYHDSIPLRGRMILLKCLFRL